MSHPNPQNLYCNPETIEFVLVSQRPSNDIPYLDLEFADADLCVQAILTFDFEEGQWGSMIVTSDTPDGDFSQEHKTSVEQHTALIAAVPPLIKNFQEAAQEMYLETGGFDNLNAGEVVALLKAGKSMSL